MRQLWDIAYPRTWPGCSSNVPSSSSWGLMICTSTLQGQLPRAFNPQRYDTMLNVVSSISLLFLFFLLLSPSTPSYRANVCLSNWPSHLSIFLIDGVIPLLLKFKWKTFPKNVFFLLYSFVLGARCCGVAELSSLEISSQSVCLVLLLLFTLISPF